MTRILVLALLAVVALPASAEELLVRKIVSEQPLSGAERMKVVISMLTVKPGGRVPLHTHAGDEHAVVLKGGDVILPDGKEHSFSDGMVLFFPAGTVHGGVASRGDTDLDLMTTHVVVADQPFSTPAE